MAIYDLAETAPAITEIHTGDILNCSYSGQGKGCILPPGKYLLEVWGAQGGYYYKDTTSINGGGYSHGILKLTEATQVYCYAGQCPINTIITSSWRAADTVPGGFNGGGIGRNTSKYNSAGGGGGSDIRLLSDSLYSRVIVAGGGGGTGESPSSYPGGYGGGLTGGDSTNGWKATGGTQTAAGTVSWSQRGVTFINGGFGYSGSATVNTSIIYADISFSGGGGGWYGGHIGDGGSGGSGYVYTSTTASNYPSGCLLNSWFYLSNAETINGNTSIIEPNGSTSTGHMGNGFCRITVMDSLYQWGNLNTAIDATLAPNITLSDEAPTNRSYRGLILGKGHQISRDIWLNLGNLAYRDTNLQSAISNQGWNSQLLPNTTGFFVSTSASPIGCSLISPTAWYLKSSDVEIRALPDTGYVTDQWIINGTLVRTGGDLLTIYNLNENKSVLVTFKLDSE